MESRLIGGLRLLLLGPLYLCLVAIDEPARWAALWIYLASVAGGRAQRRRGRSASALARIGDDLLPLVSTVGLVVGGAITLGAAAAGVMMVARRFVRLEYGPSGPARAAGAGVRIAEAGLALLAVLGFALSIAPRVPGAPLTFDTHALGGALLMAAGVGTAVGVAVDSFFLGRSARFGGQ